MNFFLTKGFFRNMSNANSLLAQAAGAQTTGPHSIPILKIVAMNQRLLTLYDGERTACASVSPDLIGCLCSSHEASCTAACACQRLRPGLVILLLGHSPVDMLSSSCEADRAHLQIDKFEAVGFESIDMSSCTAAATTSVKIVTLDTIEITPPQPTAADSNKLEAATTSTLSFVEDDDDEARHGDTFECTHRLEQLTTDTKQWACLAWVTAIGEVSTFTRPYNKGESAVQRFQLRDKNAQLEMVVFKPYCYALAFTSIKLNELYHISCGELRPANEAMSKWPYSTMTLGQQRKFQRLPFEVHVNKATRVRACDYKRPKEQAYVCLVAEDDVPGLSEPPSPPTTKHDTIVRLDCLSSFSSTAAVAPRGPKRLKLNDVIHMSNKSVVTVLVVVVELLPFDPLVDVIPSKNRYAKPGSEIAVRRIVVTDTSGVQVKCAFWGKQATKFSLQPAECVLLRDVQVSNYGGVSLSVRQTTGLMSFGSCEKLGAELRKHLKASRVQTAHSEITDIYFEELCTWWQSSHPRMHSK